MAGFKQTSMAGPSVRSQAGSFGCWMQPRRRLALDNTEIRAAGMDQVCWLGTAPFIPGQSQGDPRAECK
jgi:hypothetical protein